MDKYVEKFVSLLQDDLKDTTDYIRRNAIIYILAKIEMKSFFPKGILWIDESPEVFEGMLVDRMHFLDAKITVYISFDSFELAENTTLERKYIENYKNLFSKMVY
jgi:hypothetical protein